MSTGNLDSWVKKLKKTSEIVADYISGSQPDDSFGWGSRVSLLANSLPDVEISGLLITGPDGCGKHTCAAHMINSLRSNGYGIVFMSGEDAAACCRTGVSVSNGVSALLDDYYNRKEGLCLVFERLENFDGREELYNFLGTTVCEYHMRGDILPPLFVVIIEKEPASIPALLRSRLLQCNMVLPTHSNRVEYLKNNAVDIVSFVDMNRLAAATEGFTYSQLFNLVKNIRLELDSKDLNVLSGDALDSLIKIHARAGYENSDKQTLLKKAEALIDMLPTMIGQIGKQGLQLRSDAPINVQQHAANPPQESMNAGSISIDAARNKFDNMPVRDVYNDFINQRPVELSDILRQ